MFLENYAPALLPSAVAGDFSPGEIIYMPKGSSYKVLNSDSGDCFAINFDIDSNQTFEPEKWNAANSKFIYDIFNLSCTLWLKNRDSFDFKIRSLLYGLLYELKSISDETHHSKEYLKIAPAVEYIENNYAKCDISVFLSCKSVQHKRHAVSENIF